MSEIQVSEISPSNFQVTKGKQSVKVCFAPFVKYLELAIGDRYLFQHWNKVSALFGVYDLATNQYFCEYSAKDIDQRGFLNWQMIEIPKNSNSPLVACNFCKGYVYVRLSKKLALIGETNA